VSSSHPESCSDPDNCSLTYTQHLKGFGIGGAALVTRGVNRTPGQPDEPLTQALTREKRWVRDIDAYKRLYRDGVHPPRVDGSAFRERSADDRYDVEERPVNIDYEDAR
jgi:hypothetical protein